jgi:glutaredoxin
MKKHWILIVIISLIVVGAAIWLLFGRGTPVAGVGDDTGSVKGVSEAKITFFYGETCPHCKNVEKFFADNKVEDKISFDKKEVYNDQDNAALLAEKAKICNIPIEGMGVPFLWDGENSQCLMGDQPIIDFFKQKLNIQ